MKNVFLDQDKNLASTSRLKTVCFEETYGRHILKKVIENFSVDKVLDIGCGEGEDLKIVSNKFPNASLSGVDCKKTYFPKLNKLKVDTCCLNIESQILPFPDETFDLIIANQVLEHTKELFWINHEVFRVLRSGGKFCWTDMRDKKAMEKMHQNFVQAGFTIESWTDVTENVVSALDIIDEGRREMIRQSAPPSLRRSFETFGGVPGTPIYEALKSERIQYFRYLLCKPE